MTLFLDNVAKVARSVSHIDERFVYSRDPDDAHYVNLALAAGATLVVSRDKDLLALMDAASNDGRAFTSSFPGLQILTPPQFMQRIDRYSAT